MVFVAEESAGAAAPPAPNQWNAIPPALQQFARRQTLCRPGAANCNRTSVPLSRRSASQWKFFLPFVVRSFFSPSDNNQQPKLNSINCSRGTAAAQTWLDTATAYFGSLFLTRSPPRKKATECHLFDLISDAFD
jgi:hypothetical protein